MDTKWIEGIFAATAFFGVVGFIFQRVRAHMGVGVRAIQFAAIVVIAPGIIVLALEGLIDKQVIIALVSATLGYAAGLRIKGDAPENS